MKQKQLFRVVAMLLILALLMPNTLTYAVTPGSNGSSSGGKGHVSVFSVHVPGVIIIMHDVKLLMH